MSFSEVYCLGIDTNVLVSQSFLTIYHPMDYSPPGFFVHGISQAEILEWVAILFRDLPNLGIKPESPALQADSLPSELPGKLLNGGASFQS